MSWESYPQHQNPFRDNETDDFNMHSSRNRPGRSDEGTNFSSTRMLGATADPRSSGTASGSATGSAGTNPFEDDLVVDPFLDDRFAAPNSRYGQFQDRIEESKKRQLESTSRALASIYDSERMGIATAEELVHQGEQLDNVEQKVDQINQDMKTSQKHINSIKSIFGGIKNWWSGKNDESLSGTRAETEPSKLKKTVETNRQNEPHPAFRIRGEESVGFADHIDSEFQMSGPYGSQAKSSYESSYEHKQAYSSQSSEHEKQFEKNLDVMSEGLSRLKGLGLDLGDELLKQNEQVGRISTKADRADIKLRDQNKQMKDILGK